MQNRKCWGRRLYWIRIYKWHSLTPSKACGTLTLWSKNLTKKSNLCTEQYVFIFDNVCIVVQHECWNIAVWKYLNSKIFRTANFPYGEISVRRNILRRSFHTVKFPYAETSYGEISHGEISYGEVSYGEISGYVTRGRTLMTTHKDVMTRSKRDTMRQQTRLTRHY